MLAKPENRLDPNKPKHLNVMRYRLLDFIADFANWDNSTQPDYLATSRALTQAAHEALGGLPGTKPLVVDPFAGGGAIPLEALRVGADAFASDLNPVAVLLNKVVLEDIRDEEAERLDETQKRQLSENLKKAQRDVQESVWRIYKHVALLGKDNIIRTIDLGLVTSSASTSMVKFIIDRLRQDGDVEEAISPRFLTRNWPPAFQAWSTKSVRDAFFASPQFPRLLNPEAIKDTIARGVSSGAIAYVGSDRYDPFYFNDNISAVDELLHPRLD